MLIGNYDSVKRLLFCTHTAQANTNHYALAPFDSNGFCSFG
jgi:hypothetical protein